MKSNSNRGNHSVLLLAILGSLVLVNVLGIRAFGRFDVTGDHIYTLSQASKESVSSLEELVTVSAYFTENLPPPYSSNARYVRDLLEEYRAASKGKLSFEFIDPMTQETAEDKAAKKEVRRDIFGRSFREQTSVEKELTQSGIQPIEIRVIQEDQMQTKRAYMGLVIHHQEKKEVIPVVQSTASLEYDITSLIRKLSRPKSPVIGITQGHDEPKPEEKLRTFEAMLSQTYTVRPVDLSSKEKVDEDVDALFIIGPKTPFKPNELKALDQFLMRGKSAALFLDAIQVDTRTFEATPADHGLTALLATYGVTLGDKLVADVQSAQLNVQEQRGFMMISMPVPYPFIPLVQRMEGDSVISKGLGNLNFPFVTTVSGASTDGRTATVLARSSKKSWLEAKPYNTDPRRDWRSEDVTPSGPYDLMVQVSGKLKSHFAGEVPPANSSSAQSPVLGESQGESRLVVVGGSTALLDDFMGRSNEALAANVADWLVLDSAMLAMRSRGLAGAPLQADLSDGLRAAAKLGNALGMPLLLVLIGLVRWRAREARRAHVAV